MLATLLPSHERHVHLEPGDHCYSNFLLSPPKVQIVSKPAVALTQHSLMSAPGRPPVSCLQGNLYMDRIITGQTSSAFATACQGTGFTTADCQAGSKLTKDKSSQLIKRTHSNCGLSQSRVSMSWAKQPVSLWQKHPWSHF